MLEHIKIGQFGMVYRGSFPKTSDTFIKKEESLILKIKNLDVLIKIKH